MTKYAIRSNDEMTSEFIVSTCQLLPKSVYLASDHIRDLVMTRSPATKEYSILCGSSAEFYIQPLNTCITDINVLVCSADELVYSGDCPVLPADKSGLADTITCFEITSYEWYPSFVQLRVSGEMNFNWISKKYQFHQPAQPANYMTLELDASKILPFPRELNRDTLPSIVSGPAIKCQADSNLGFEFDMVKGLFCPQWPIEAKYWPIRMRNYGWPTTDTISEVVRTDCHVVYAQHRSCRADKSQWRLSFSLAEAILIQTLTKVQQIVYHLLRFFAKRELMQGCSKEDELLCPYQIKTLMLWTCESMAPDWWSSSSVIAICCELLKKLSEWLTRTYCPNYFIHEANLFHPPSKSRMLHQIERQLNRFTNSEVLSHWFVANYILPIIRTQFGFLNTRSLLPNFTYYLSPFVEYRKARKFESFEFLYSLKFSDSNMICRREIKYGMCRIMRHGQYTEHFNSKSHNTMTDLPTTEQDSCFKYFNALLYSLHTANGLRYGEISWDSSLFVEFLKVMPMQPTIIRCKYHNFPKTQAEQSSRFKFLRAEGLMENLTGSNVYSEFRLVSVLSKALITEALKCEDFHSNGITRAALAYLAALQFSAPEYQQAIHCCFAVLADKTSKKDKETLNAGCLLFVDGVARIVGLCVLHKKITDNRLHYLNRRLYLDLRLSPEVFAHYIMIVFAAERISTHLDAYYHLPDTVFHMDDYL